MTEIKDSRSELIVSLKRLWPYVTIRRRKQIFLTSLLVVASSVIDLVSLGSVLPFIAVLTEPDRVFGYPFVADIAGFFGIDKSDNLVIPLTCAFFALVALAAVVRTSLLWITTRLGVVIGADISAEIYRKALDQDYEAHLVRNSSELIDTTSAKVNSVPRFVAGFLLIFGSIISLVAIVVLLLLIEPVAATVALGVFGGSYWLIARFVKQKLRRLSSLMATNTPLIIRALQEGFGSIRDVILDNAQSRYVEIFRRADRPTRKAQGDIIFHSAVPRYLMEAVGMIVVAALALVFHYQDGGVIDALPVLGALALGGQRLLPALQQIYGSWSQMTGDNAALSDAMDLLELPVVRDHNLVNLEPLSLNNEIKFEDVRFRYSDSEPLVLNGLNFTIEKGKRFGLVGSSGSGKSTTLDLLMGFLQPTEGQLTVDGVLIHGGNIRNWQRTIAHVPQHLFLADTTIEENIALSSLDEGIDQELVRLSAHTAGLAEFIESSPLGYKALVGERGAWLSGGQLQRIGIARALYKKASLLIFDEATSALDAPTEMSILDSLEGLTEQLTMIIVTHRVSSLQSCDAIMMLEGGSIVEVDTYKNLIEKNPIFRLLANPEENEGMIKGISDKGSGEVKDA